MHDLQKHNLRKQFIYHGVWLSWGQWGLATLGLSDPGDPVPVVDVRSRLGRYDGITVYQGNHKKMIPPKPSTEPPLSGGF